VGWAACCLLSLGSLSACAPGDPSGPPAQHQQFAAVALSINGVPDGFAAAVTITGPGGTRTVGTSGTVSGLTAGTYSITASDIPVGNDVYSASPTFQSVTLSAGETATASAIAYALATGSLSISVDGLPSGTAADITVAGPAGYDRKVPATSILSGLVPGTYSIEARRVQSGGFSYDALAPIMALEVAASSIPTAASVTYEVASGALSVGVTGLPAGVSALVRVTGPEGYDHTLTGSEVLSDLAPGTYTVLANAVTAGPDTWTAPLLAPVEVHASIVPTTVNVPYAIATGQLMVRASGQPGGSNPMFTVTGPASYTSSVAAGTTLVGLAPGTYTVTAPDITNLVATYRPTPSTAQVNVPASTVPVEVAFVYAVSTAGLQVSITGLPQGTAGNVSVTGPAGFQTVITATTTITNLATGEYTITASTVSSGLHQYGPLTPAVTVLTLQASETPTAVSVVYDVKTGLIDLSVLGLPTGLAASITVSGPNGYLANVLGSTLLSGLAPGTYDIVAASVSDGTTWVPSPSALSVTVQASTVAAPASVTYWQEKGTLTVNVTGLPGGTDGDVTVTGPNGYSSHLTSSQVLSVPTGNYAVAAAVVVDGATTYTPTPTSQPATVTAGASTVATVAYSGSVPSGLNLTIDGVYITQSVQTYANSMALVAGRDGLLRVFVKASEANSATPAVRVRFYSGATLLSTTTIPAPSSSVPTAIAEGTLGSSWNATLSGAFLQAGLSMLVDVDPTNTVTESVESDNTWPPSGTAAALNVKPLTPIATTLVPVLQQATGLTGNVSAGNMATFLLPMQKMMPAPSIDGQLHATYTTTADTLKSNGANWGTLLSEINALRVAEGSSRLYYGVVKVSYTSGVAGLGYIGAPAAIGWDHLPSGADVMAHEVGHNFGRLHAPCGGPSGVDPDYPSDPAHAGAKIGAWGYDILTGSLKSPSTYVDLMSYCNPEWISDYNYAAIISYREAHPFVTSTRVIGATARRSLLVWGHIADGQAVLEPAFEVDAPASLPTRPGPHRIEAFGPSGQQILSLSFDGERIADATDPNAQTFAFAIPLDQLRGIPLERLRLTAAGVTADVRSAGARLDTPVLSSVSALRDRLTLGAGAGAALVRNARTGQVLSIVRGRTVDLAAGTDDLDVTLSDGIRSRRTTVSRK